mgnify:CR=1 FL=1
MRTTDYHNAPGAGKSSGIQEIKKPSVWQNGNPYPTAFETPYNMVYEYYNNGTVLTKWKEKWVLSIQAFHRNEHIEKVKIKYPHAGCERYEYNLHSEVLTIWFKEYRYDQ